MPAACAPTSPPCCPAPCLPLPPGRAQALEAALSDVVPNLEALLVQEHVAEVTPPTGGKRLDKQEGEAAGEDGAATAASA